jgi:hypothetical protein
VGLNKVFNARTYEFLGRNVLPSYLKKILIDL